MFLLFFKQPILEAEVSQQVTGCVPEGSEVIMERRVFYFKENNNIFCGEVKKGNGTVESISECQNKEK